ADRRNRLAAPASRFPRRARATEARRRSRPRGTTYARPHARTRRPKRASSRAPRESATSRGARLLASVTLAHSRERGTVDLVGARQRHPCLRDRTQGRGSTAGLDDGAFAEDRSRSDLAQRRAVDLDRDHAVEKKVEL